MSRVRIVCLTVFLAALVAAPVAAQNPAPAPAPAPAGQAQRPAPAPASPTALAFPTYEVTFGYQLLHVPDETFPYGVNLDGAWNPSKAFGVVGEIGWAYDSDNDIKVHAWNLGVGPRFNARADRFSPFGQLLVGGVHYRASTEINGQKFKDNETKFMVQPGVGVNVIAGDGWGITGQVDYRRVFLDKDTDGKSGENDFRVFLGLRLLLD